MTDSGQSIIMAGVGALRRWVVVGWTLASLSVAACIASVTTWVLGGISVHQAYSAFLLSNVVMAACFAPVGALVASRRPRNPLGWLLVAYSFCFAFAACTGSIGIALGMRGHDHAFRLLAVLFMGSWPVAIYACLPVFLQLYPTGHAAGRRRRWLLVPVVPSAVLGVIGGVVSPTALRFDGVPKPLSGPVIDPTTYHRFDVVWAVGEPLNGLILVASLGVLVSRFRRAGDTERRQLLWLFWAAAIFFLANLPRWMTGNGPIATLYLIVIVAAALGVALLRHRLLDIDIVIQRSLVYLILTAIVLGAYSGIVLGADRLVGSGSLTGVRLATVAGVAVAFAPLREQVQRAVERLLFGERRDPYAVVSRLGRRLAEVPAADEVLPAIVDTVAESLRLPYVALEVPSSTGPVTAAVRGVPTGLVEHVPLRYQGETVGTLAIGLRPGEREVDARVREILDELARQAGVAVRNAALTAALRYSHERLVAAREDERRRLRRDLHDGLGPQLTGVTFKTDAVRNLLRSDPDRAEELLEQARAETTAAIADVRRLVYDLRPPALDDLGLLGALELEAERLSAGGVQLTLDVQGQLPPLPAAVEVAAYRIVTEAMANAVRHAGARRCAVNVHVDGHLRLEIIDDGSGGEAWRPGVGLTSMRERAAELGGSCTAGPGPRGGRVVAALPLEMG